ncbi:MAG: 4Fe-4S binding protein [Planctomycetota bacterium]
MTHIRRVVQIISFLFFLLLFILTIYPLASKSPIPVELYLRTDPLLALSAVIASRALISFFILSLVMLALGLLAGRIFCGWLCPLGAILDIFNRVFFLKKWRPHVLEEKFEKLRNLKYVLLAALLLLAAFGIQISGWFDPISVLTRSMAVVVFPFFDQAFRAWVGEPNNMWLLQDVMDLKTPVFNLQILFLVIMVLILLAEILQSRFWCRNLCPLGALYGLLGRFRFFRLEMDSDCNECGLCEESCKTGAIQNNAIIQRECITCFSCRKACPFDTIKVRFSPRLRPPRIPEHAGAMITRRESLVALLGTAAAIPLMKFSAGKRFVNPRLIRPPGVAGEEEFLLKCVRCGQCMKICPNNALHPTLFEAGLSGMFTPRLVPKIGYCEQFCTRCGDVCASGAIPRLEESEQAEYKMGLAVFRYDKCIPYAEKDNCSVCEEHCPIPEKAIRLVEKDEIDKDGKPLYEPYVVEDLCTGCGICETKCPLEGDRGIEIWRRPGM